MVLALFSQEINESVNDVVQSFFISKFSKESKFYVEKKLYDQLAFDGDLELVSFVRQLRVCQKTALEYPF